MGQTEKAEQAIQVAYIMGWDKTSNMGQFGLYADRSSVVNTAYYHKYSIQ
jgi:hypothetical protein